MSDPPSPSSPHAHRGDHSSSPTPTTSSSSGSFTLTPELVVAFSYALRIRHDFPLSTGPLSGAQITEAFEHLFSRPAPTSTSGPFFYISLIPAIDDLIAMVTSLSSHGSSSSLSSLSTSLPSSSMEEVVVKINGADSSNEVSSFSRLPSASSTSMSSIEKSGDIKDIKVNSSNASPSGGGSSDSMSSISLPVELADNRASSSSPPGLDASRASTPLIESLVTLASMSDYANIESHAWSDSYTPAWPIDRDAIYGAAIDNPSLMADYSCLRSEVPAQFGNSYGANSTALDFRVPGTPSSLMVDPHGLVANILDDGFDLEVASEHPRAPPPPPASPSTSSSVSPTSFSSAAYRPRFHEPQPYNPALLVVPKVPHNTPPKSSKEKKRGRVFQHFNVSESRRSARMEARTQRSSCAIFYSLLSSRAIDELIRPQCCGRGRLGLLVKPLSAARLIVSSFLAIDFIFLVLLVKFYAYLPFCVVFLVVHLSLELRSKRIHLTITFSLTGMLVDPRFNTVGAAHAKPLFPHFLMIASPVKYSQYHLSCSWSRGVRSSIFFVILAVLFSFNTALCDTELTIIMVLPFLIFVAFALTLAQEDVEERAWRAREEGEKLNVEGEGAVQAATTTPVGAAAAGTAQEECKGPESAPAARAASAHAAERGTSEAEEDQGVLANTAESLTAVIEIASPDYTPIRPARTPSPPNNGSEEVNNEEVDTSTAISAEEAREKDNAPAGLHRSLRTSPSPVAASPAPSDLLLVTPSTTGGTSAMSIASASPVSPLAARDLARSWPTSPFSDGDSTVTVAPSARSASVSSAESGGYGEKESEANVSWSDVMDLVAPLTLPPLSQRPRAAVVAAPRRAMRARRVAAREEEGQQSPDELDLLSPPPADRRTASA
ncbi:hypothetical protein JCM10449v2_007584 [Rhodotorula kratochvilovae]